MPDFAVARERALAGNHRPLHLRQVVAEADRVDQLAGPLVVLRIERVDVADAAAHEQEDDGLRLGREDAARAAASGISPASAQNAAQRDAEEPAAGSVEKATPRDPAAGIEPIAVHSRSPHVNELVEVEQQPGEALQSGRIVAEIRQRVVLFPRRRGAGQRRSGSRGRPPPVKVAARFLA